MSVIMLAAALSFTSLPRPDENDLRCLAYLTVAERHVDGDLQRRVEGGALYYFGRLEARAPDLDVETALAAIIKSPQYDRSAYEADKARCHAELDPLAARFEHWRSANAARGAAAGSGK